MRKKDLIAQLTAIPGDPEILSWDPNDNIWAPVTGFTYDEREVKLYTEEEC